jgi:anaerobic dimethyl sulfoxide reductase subunit C (anchor subunit)
MKERSLAAFTILSQMAIGAFWLLSVLNGLNAVKLLILTAIMLVALAASFLHLGSPFNAWRAFSGWRSSWLSREVLCAALFTALLGGLALAAWRQIDLAGTGMWLAALCGLVLLINMTMAYRLRTVPTWNHWATAASFFITTLLLGVLWCGMLIGGRPWLAASAIVLLGAQQAIGWRRPQVDRWRHLILAWRVSAVSALVIVLFAPQLWIAWPAAFLLALGSEVMARMLFYEMRKPRRRCGSFHNHIGR